MVVRLVSSGTMSSPPSASASSAPALPRRAPCSHLQRPVFLGLDSGASQLPPLLADPERLAPRHHMAGRPPRRCVFASALTQRLLVLNRPDYMFQRWHGTLVCIVVALPFNNFSARPLGFGLVVERSGLRKEVERMGLWANVETVSPQQKA